MASKKRERENHKNYIYKTTMSCVVSVLLLSLLFIINYYYYYYHYYYLLIFLYIFIIIIVNTIDCVMDKKTTTLNVQQFAIMLINQSLKFDKCYLFLSLHSIFLIDLISYNI